MTDPKPRLKSTTINTMSNIELGSGAEHNSKHLILCCQYNEN